jgi:multisubunit Na+/H+ antiporter MnhC subunit
MQTTATYKVAVLVLTALVITTMVFAFACAITATDAEAGTRVGSSPGTREST